MVVTFLNWIWAFITIFLTGYLTVRIIGRLLTVYDKKSTVVEMDLIIAFGLAFVTVYAVFFSLFYRVGIIANLGLGLICIVTITVYRRELPDVLRKGCCCFAKSGAVIIVIGIYFMAVSTLKVQHPDTHLYHAQAIEWIENYGVTKGLGNLLSNFAYNSAFFSLQALYSWKSIVGQSMHGMNAFIAWLAVSYASLSIKSIRYKRIMISDIMRMTTVLYTFYVLNMLSSPNSDTFPTVFNLYILTKWIETTENESEKPEEQADRLSMYGILAVFNVTVKLSFAPFVLLCLYPFALYNKKKQIFRIFIVVAMGTVTVVPFLIRNVLLSGYLIYPVTALDFFDVDWKMPHSLVQADGAEIMAWARGMTSHELYHAGIGTWFPVWWDGLDLVCILCIVFAALIIPLVIVQIIRGIVKRDITFELFFEIVCLISFTYWFLTAPSIRYGMPYAIILLAAFGLTAGMGIDKAVLGLTAIFSAASILGCVGGFPVKECPFILPQDYGLYNYKTGAIISSTGEEMCIYYPSSDDIDSYPTYTPFPVRISGHTDDIEMRGTDLSEGFRHK